MNAPRGDTNFRWRSVEKSAQAAGPIYRLLGAEGRLNVDHPDSGFPEDRREAAYRVIDSVLRP